jgi:hypothetical protein
MKPPVERISPVS